MVVLICFMKSKKKRAVTQHWRAHFSLGRRNASLQPSGTVMHFSKIPSKLSG